MLIVMVGIDPMVVFGILGIVRRMSRGELGDKLGTVSAFPAAEVAPRSAFALTREQFLVLLAGYFGLHALVRAAVSKTAGIDDVDQVLQA